MRSTPRLLTVFLTLVILMPGLGSLTLAAPKDTRFYEMRVYYSPPGKLDDLHARFRNHTCQLFAKHGMENIGYWVPAENPDNKLIYILAYPSREARGQCWRAFGSDPAWKEVVKKSEAQGPLVKKVESIFMNATDYSPAVQPSKPGADRVFELRTYKATPGKLDALNARFRDHTLKLFSKHGMTHIGYWTPTEKKDGSEDTLIYILAHPSQAARDKAFDGFRKDPDWVAAKSASEKDGSLTVKVDSLLMKPTDYSQTR